MSTPALAFKDLPGITNKGEPVYIEWFGNYSVSTRVLPYTLTTSASNILVIKPVNITLYYDTIGGGYVPVSVIVTNITGELYEWTPSDSLTPGSYALELSQQNETTVCSNPIWLANDTSTDSTASMSAASFISSTVSASTASSTQSSPAGSTSSSGILASGHGSSLIPSTAIVTIPSTSATFRANSSQSQDIQSVSVLHNPISNGTIAGIVVGVVVFLIITTALAALYRRRRRRSSHPAVSELPAHQTDNDVKSDPGIWIPELDQEGAVYGPHELADTPTPMAQSLRSLGTTKLQTAEGRVSGVAQSLQSLKVTGIQSGEESIRDIGHEVSCC